MKIQANSVKVEETKDILDLKEQCYKCEKRLAKDALHRKFLNPYSPKDLDADFLLECMHCQMASLDPIGPVIRSLLPDLIELKIHKKEFTCSKEVRFQFDSSQYKDENYEIEVRCMLADSTRENF